MRTVLFDLDGTIINSEAGITNCIRYVLDYYNMEQPPQESLRCFIGPPLREQFQKIYGFDAEKAEVSVLKFRERFDRLGIFECELYPGVSQLIQNLKKKGHKIALTSSKHEDACVRILEHFHLERYFDEIVGATRDGKISSKKQVIESLFDKMSLVKENCILIGDTKFDVIGAKEAGISCIGVTYGFGSEEELKKAGADTILKTCQEVEEYLETI